MTLDLNTINPKFYQRLNQYINNDESHEHDFNPEITIPLLSDCVPDCLIAYIDKTLELDEVFYVILKPEYIINYIGKKITENNEQSWFLIDKRNDQNYKEKYYLYMATYINEESLLEVIDEIEFADIDKDILYKTHEVISENIANHSIQSLFSEDN